MENDRRQRDEEPERRASAAKLKGLHILAAIAILCAIINLAEELVGYFGDGTTDTVRIVMRTLGIAGWCVVLFYYIKTFLYVRKH